MLVEIFVTLHHLFQIGSAKSKLKLHYMSAVHISPTMASVTRQDANFSTFRVRLFQVVVPVQSWGPRRTWCASSSAVQRASSLDLAQALSNRTHLHDPTVQTRTLTLDMEMTLSCFTQIESKKKKRKIKLTLKSSLAWAPLLSFLCSAE